MTLRLSASLEETYEPLRKLQGVERREHALEVLDLLRRKIDREGQEALGTAVAGMNLLPWVTKS